ncbi:aminomethyl-transferring glycine dehydrogenase [Humidisolicoccus flavus]|uniref:aminomethyl-transferring glycine dehydrogenase n=1 Tax=Humidisolicoccus flavus TaxID=3111414 RepID=UPI0032566B02
MRAFEDRHIGIDQAAESVMLETLGYESLDAMMHAAIPSELRGATPDFGDALSETAVIKALRELADQNTVHQSAIGLGYSGTITPAPIQRNILENPAWYTAYTPYQPEISQGRLEALINFQTMVAELAGLTTANASMLDESTAVVEAMLLARRASKNASQTFIVDTEALPQTKALLRHRAKFVGIELVELDVRGTEVLPAHFGLFVQYPGASGLVWDWRERAAASHEQGGIVIAAADLLALTLIEAPGTLGADVAVGSSQRFGVPLGFGGPHAGYLAVREGLERQMPGRLVGVSKDADGNPAYRLTLQTREQHIRRERATSNICTAQVLLAVMASMYAVYHGPEGLRQIATAVHGVAAEFAEAAQKAGLQITHEAFFDTVRVTVPGNAADYAARAEQHGILIHVVDADTLHLAFDETWIETGLSALLAAFGWESAGHDSGDRALAVARTTEYLTHPVFSSYHSETALMRYMRRLADRDYALDRGMIPLGSCTMKLNAATEMQAVTWPEFSGVHPFAPRAHAAGTLSMIDDLSKLLADMTGYDTVSLQPNAGSQGELAGLLAIRGYHDSNGDQSREVCLIPASAHGTNAASAVLAGMRVVVVATDDEGNVDLDDLRAKVSTHAEALAALMITYPSTHGVYETTVREICDAVHDAGGQVYIDGANCNALLGYASFGDLGGDVSHLNLHKTFCIPHGGGGPGVGPVAAKSHLAPFLPRDPRDASQIIDGLELGENPVSAAPWGSASILPISWSYVRMMGLSGLTRATATAVLAANYIAKRLEPFIPVLYTGANGLVAHECILDLRPMREASGVTVDDVAKRLVDYGFHSPTMSFPVAGTLMVEPTESEDIVELDRFIDAMIAICHEAKAIEEGEVEHAQSALARAPHTATSIVGEWDRPYSRQEGVFPVAGMERSKYWPVVSRVDQAFGDRNLACSCPPPEAFASA